MLNYFLQQTYQHQPGIKYYSRFDYIKKRYKEEITKIIEYHGNRVRAVNNSHLLVRLIKLLSPFKFNMDFFDYFKYVDSNAKYYTKQLGIVSNINNGLVLENIFYKNNSYEVLLYSNRTFDIFDMEYNWDNYFPIRVIYTSEREYDFHLLDGSKMKLEPDLTVLEINIPMLMLQYKQWALEKDREGNSTSPAIFLCQVVFPSILVTMIDMITWNRFIYRNDGIQSIEQYRVKHPFHILDLTPGIDDILDNVHNDVSNVSQYLDKVLMSIPTIYYKDMTKTLFIANPFPTKQSEWVVWLARLRTIRGILNLLGEKGIARNRSIVNSLPFEIRRLKNNSTNLFRIIPYDLKDICREDIEYIGSILGVR